MFRVNFSISDSRSGTTTRALEYQRDDEQLVPSQWREGEIHFTEIPNRGLVSKLNSGIHLRKHPLTVANFKLSQIGSQKQTGLVPFPNASSQRSESTASTYISTKVRSAEKVDTRRCRLCFQLILLPFVTHRNALQNVAPHNSCIVLTPPERKKWFSPSHLVLENDTSLLMLGLSKKCT